MRAIRTCELRSRSWRRSRGTRRGSLGQRIGQNVTVARNQRDATNFGERWRDVGGRGVGVIFAGLNAVTHKDYGDALIVVIRRSVRGAVAAWTFRGAVIPGPVGLGDDDEIAAARFVKTVGFGAQDGIQCGWTAFDFVGEINFGDTRNAFDGFYEGVVGLRERLEFIEDAGLEIDVATADAGDGGLGNFE